MRRWRLRTRKRVLQVSVEHSARAMRPLGIFIPLKAGTGFAVIEDEDADEGAGLIRIEIERVFDFRVALTVENYGTLTKLIEALQTAQTAELERIKKRSALARNARSRSYKEIRTQTEERRKAVKGKPRRRRGSGVAGEGSAPTRPPRKRNK